MTPDMIITVAQLLIRYGPGVAQSFVELFHKKEITQADWDKTFALAQKSYDQYIAEAKTVAAPA